MIIIGWAKKFVPVFNILWKNQNHLFGQPNTCLVFHQTPNLKHRLVDLMEKEFKGLRSHSGAGGLTGGFWGCSIPPALGGHQAAWRAWRTSYLGQRQREGQVTAHWLWMTEGSRMFLNASRGPDHPDQWKNIWGPWATRWFPWMIYRGLWSRSGKMMGRQFSHLHVAPPVPDSVLVHHLHSEGL